MKLYIPPEPASLLRVNIKKQGCKTEHIAIDDSTVEELIQWLQQLIESRNLSIFATGKITTVEVREVVKGQNGRMMSFHFRGLDPDAVIMLIANALHAVAIIDKLTEESQ